MDNFKDLMKKVKIPDALQVSPDKKNLKTIHKQLEEKIHEKNNIYGFMGMEVYDLAKAKKIDIAQIAHYIGKLDQLSEEIQALEKQKTELEAKSVKKIVCSCGYQLNSQDRFCPRCGKPAVGETHEPAKIKPEKECICGAKVPQGQTLCFQCGRKI